MNQYEYLKHRDEFESFLLEYHRFFIRSYLDGPLLYQRDHDPNYNIPLTNAFSAVRNFLSEEVDYDELYIREEWSLSGTHGNCFDNQLFHSKGDKEPYFTDFYTVCNLIDDGCKPDRYLDLIETMDEPDGDFYGGSWTMRTKFVNLYKLFIAIKGLK